jgi:c-di-GMP-related signal transduction protein
VNANNLFLGRQPILDRRGNLVAFELLFRSSQANGAHIDDDLLATATVINHAFSELGVEAVLGHFTGYINLSASLLMSEVIELLPKERVVLEVLETVEINDALVARLRELRSAGFRLALDDFAGDTERYARILDFIDVVKVEIPGHSDAELAETTARLRRWPVRLLAEKVNNREQVDRCMALGYELFQGYYFAKPTVLEGKRLSHTESAIMQLTGLVVSDADTTEIEQIFKQNPDLTINLLRLVNSVSIGARTRINSLKGAIAVLGRSQLQRWLQLLMFATAASPDAQFPSPLLMLAATRGKLMELMSTAAGGARQSDDAFLAGILSLVGALLGRPLEEILASLAVSEQVRAAVLRREGRLGDLLNLAVQVELSDVPGIERQIERIDGLNATRVGEAYVGAIEWANSIADAAP